MSEDKEIEELRRRLKNPPRFGQPTRHDVRSMSLEALRDLFDRGAFDLSISWDDLMRVRAEP